MNIAIFTNNYLPNPYGVTISIENFRRQFEKMGHSVYIFAPHQEGYEDENQNVFRFPSVDLKYKINFPLPIPFSRELDKKIDELEIDIVHSQHPNLLGDTAMRWAKKKNIPLVFTWHTLYDRYTNYIPLIPNDWAAKWAIDNAVKYSNQCDFVIVPTASVEKLIRDWGVKNKNIQDILTGVDVDNFTNPDGGKIRKKHKIGQDEIVLFSASRLTQEKNIIFLLGSIIEVIKKNDKVKFILGGEGYLREEIENIISDNNMQERIILPGLILRDELKDYFSAADIFVYSSVSETQGNILSEAMYAGVASVAVNSTGSCDLVEHEKTGLLVPHDKDEFSVAVEKLTLDDGMRKAFGQESMRLAKEKYTDRVCAKRMIEVYEELIVKMNN